MKSIQFESIIWEIL